MINSKLKLSMITLLTAIMVTSILIQPFEVSGSESTLFGLKVGDSAIFTSAFSDSGSTTTKTGISFSYSSNGAIWNTYKVVKINTSSDEVTGNFDGNVYGNGNYTVNVNNSYIINFLNYFLDLGFTYNKASNSTVLTYLFVPHILNRDWNLIDTGFANWEYISTQLSNYFSNTSSMIGIWGIYQDLTLGNLLGNTSSYKIMGQSSLGNVAKQFTSTTRSWSFEFDFNNKMYYYDQSTNVFTPYSSYVVTGLISYNTNGILSEAKFSLSNQINNSGSIQSDTMQFEVQQGTGTGTGSSSSTPGFDIFTALLVIPILTIPMLNKRSKGKKY